MSYRGMGGYRPPTPISRSPRRAAAGDFLDDFSLGGDWGFGSFDLADPVTTALAPSDAGGGFLDTLGGVWDDVGGFLGDIGLTGPKIGSTIASGVKSMFGGGGGSPAAAGAASGGSRAQKAAVMRALRGGGGRRMNPGNFKALRRSMRRLTAFERAAKRVLHFTHPSKGARVKFKFSRRKRR